MARPTKLTPETHKKIVQAIQLGATYELAASYGGVTYESFNNWMKAGADAKSGIFFTFFQDIKEAQGKAVVGWLAKIEQAANDGHWQAAAWKLERRHPEDYGRTVVDNNNNNSGDLSITVRYVDEHES